jgi:Protein of unknown function (DUF935)
MNQQHNKKDEIIINELIIRSVDRSRKDISQWRNALIAAESVYFPNRSRLYDLYFDVVLDGHLSGIIAKRIDTVLNKELYFEHNGTKCPAFDSLLNSLPFRTLMRTVMETQFWGISGLEFIPGKMFDFKLIPRKHIRPDLNVITFEQTGTDGIAYADLDNVWVIGDAQDLGILLRCAPYCLYKRGALADWAEYLELFGQPVRIIKYDSYDEQTKYELKKILEQSGSSLAMMIPRQADFEMKDGKQNNGDGNLQLSFIKALNEELSIIVLGNTETTTSAFSTGYAQSKVHLEQQLEIMRSDLAYTTAMLNQPQLLKVLRTYGYPTEGGKFVFAKDTDINYLQARIAIDKEVSQFIEVPKSYWRDTYGITKD